jgi:acyl-coenzyme A thioesterase PaaI-like protein
MEIETDMMALREMRPSEASDTEEQAVIELTRAELEAYLPHTGKALVLDSISIYASRWAIGKLALSSPARDYIFEGHAWAMPGHWISEFANITAACLVAKSHGITFDKRRGVLATHNCSNFHSPVKLHDRIRCETEILECDSRRALLRAIVRNQDGRLVTEIPSIRGVILGVRKVAMSSL